MSYVLYIKHILCYVKPTKILNMPKNSLELKNMYYDAEREYFMHWVQAVLRNFIQKRVANLFTTLNCLPIFSQFINVNWLAFEILARHFIRTDRHTEWASSSCGLDGLHTNRFLQLMRALGPVQTPPALELS